MTKYLLFSLCLLATACASEYSTLKATQNLSPCESFIGQEFQGGWYTAHIDVYGRHLSGLLLIKNTGGSYRTVFTSEAGLTLFDFGFSADGRFTVHRVISQLDRKPVISVLRNDFALLLRLPFRKTKLDYYSKGQDLYVAAHQKNETAYFITDRECASLQRLELGSKRKRKVSITVRGKSNQPDSLDIVHHTFDMAIRLNKIERE